MSSSSSNHTLTKIPILVNVFKFVFSSRLQKNTSKLVKLSTVTSSWRETMEFYDGAVLPYSFGLHQNTGVTHLKTLFMIACSKGFFWIVDTLVKAGIERDQVRDTEAVKEPGRSKAVQYTALYATLAPKCVTQDNNLSSIAERAAIVEILITPEVHQLKSKREVLREQAKAADDEARLQKTTAEKQQQQLHQHLPFQALDYCDEKGVKGYFAAFELAIGRGLVGPFKAMFKLYVDRKLKPFFQGRLSGEINDKNVINEHIVHCKFYPLIRAVSQRSKGHVEILKIMLQEDVYFADLETLHLHNNPKQHNNMSVLCHAARGLNAEGIKLILEHEKKLTAHIPIQERKCSYEQRALLHYPDDALYLQKHSLLFMMSGGPVTTNDDAHKKPGIIDDRFEQRLPITQLFSPPTHDDSSSTRGGETTSNKKRYDFWNENYSPTVVELPVSRAADPSPIFDCFRVLADAYKRNKHELFSEEELKKFIAPNRLPGITCVNTNTSVFSLFTMQFCFKDYLFQKTKEERENHIFHKVAQFLFTEPQKLGFDRLDFNEYGENWNSPLYCLTVNLLDQVSAHVKKLSQYDCCASVFDLVFELGNADPMILAKTDRFISSALPHHGLISRVASEGSAASVNRHATVFKHPTPLPLFLVTKTSSWDELDASVVKSRACLGPILIFLSLYGTERMIEYFIRKRGADVNCIAPYSKMRPIHNAVKGNANIANFEIVSKYLEERCDVMHLHQKNGNRERSGDGVDKENLFDVKTAEGLTPLMCACQATNTSPIVVETLLKKYKVNANAVDNDGNNAGNNALFHYFRKEQSEQQQVLIKLLQDHGCDINKKNAKGVSPSDLQRSCDRPLR